MCSSKAFRIFSLSVVLAVLFAVFPSHDESIAHAQQPQPQGNVLNAFGAPVGAVDKSGVVSTAHGSRLGSVDADGNVYNVSDFKLGSVRAGGNVFLAGGAARIIFFRSSRGGPIRPVPLPRPR